MWPPPKPSAEERQGSIRRIVVSIPDRQLILIDNGRIVKTYSVAVGAPETPSPTGTFQVVTRVSDPAWYQPGKVVPPGPGNPLGPRWIGLSQEGLRHPRYQQPALHRQGEIPRLYTDAQLGRGGVVRTGRHWRRRGTPAGESRRAGSSTSHFAPRSGRKIGSLGLQSALPYPLGHLMTQLDLRRDTRYEVQLSCRIFSPLPSFSELAGVTLNMSRSGLLAVFGERGGPTPALRWAPRFGLQWSCPAPAASRPATSSAWGGSPGSAISPLPGRSRSPYSGTNSSPASGRIRRNSPPTFPSTAFDNSKLVYSTWLPRGPAVSGRPLPPARYFTTNTSRSGMYGKAVQSRHCPATVSGRL